MREREGGREREKGREGGEGGREKDRERVKYLRSWTLPPLI